MINAGLFSSVTGEWETPQWLFDKLDKVYSFDFDVCATRANNKCKSCFTLETGLDEDDGLLKEWSEIPSEPSMLWMNPPYGRGINEWVKKAWEASELGQTVVCLLPARTDTAWWHDYCIKGEVHFLRGRLKFSGHKGSAPFPSAVVIFWGWEDYHPPFPL